MITFCSLFLVIQVKLKIHTGLTAVIKPTNPINVTALYWTFPPLVNSTLTVNGRKSSVIIQVLK